MFRYCLDCDARLPDYLWYSNDFLCDDCDDKRWGISQDDEDDEDDDEVEDYE